MMTGVIIEITRHWDEAADAELCRVWFCDALPGAGAFGVETCIYAEIAEHMPVVGQHIWIDEGRIYFDGLRRHLIAVGNSFPAPVAEDW
jgi:hypothetical protein